jgi:DNA ligase D-like protein (predicted 3'-phosphoesterase)
MAEAKGKSQANTKTKAKGKTQAKARLAEYERKRDFSKTAEPSPGSKRRGKGGPKRRHPRFTIQKHAATSLHYDLRLEVDGVLASWAVPKGPSTNPADKRLAMRTEDHPMEYLEFEGVIPKGEYGAGPVIVWDRGVFENISETRSGEKLTLEEAVEKGDIKVFLLGEKIRGPYALVRTSPRGEREQWLLIKKRGEGADRRRNPTSTQPKSVLTGRTIEQVRKEGG